MKLPRVCLAALAPVLAAGCMYVPMGSLPKLNVQNAAMAQGVGSAEIQAIPRFISGGLSVQSLVTPYSESDVEHLVLQIFSVKDGLEMAIPDAMGNPITKDIRKADLTKPVTFPNLHFNATYRIRAFAYMATGTATADLLSIAASSSIDVALDNGDRQALTHVPVQLPAKDFNGLGTAPGIVVTPGSLVNNGDEAIP